MIPFIISGVFLAVLAWVGRPKESEPWYDRDELKRFQKDLEAWKHRRPWF